jgi:hypothetical protein
MIHGVEPAWWSNRKPGDEAFLHGNGIGFHGLKMTR